MYQVVKLAALSAALAAALVTLLDANRPAPSAARFLTDRLQTEVAPAIAPKNVTGGTVGPVSNGCLEAAWPYRDACSGTAQPSLRTVRVISPDRQASSRQADGALHVQIARR
jgi:hypothetical protein